MWKRIDAAQEMRESILQLPDTGMLCNEQYWTMYLPVSVMSSSE